MFQLNKEEISKLPAGVWNGHIRLSLILAQGEPKTFLFRSWPVKIKKVADDLTVIIVQRLTWAEYILERNCSEGGDLVSEDFLMQLYK